MNKGTLALIIQEGSKLISEVIRNRVFLFPASEAPIVKEAPDEVKPADKHAEVATGCIPCSIGHLGTCSGLLNEAMRFARAEGIQSDQVISRVNMCVDELNALERVDLRPEITHSLQDWERPIAEKALNLSRTLRHDLENLSDIHELEGTAAKTQSTRQEIGNSWFRERLNRMSPEQRTIVEERLLAKAKEREENHVQG